jgi:2-phospho-L-lactate guanylyltransferase
MIAALIPLKQPGAAKTRLAGVLSPAERRALARAMIEDVLSTVSSQSSLGRVSLVSDDPQAITLARDFGVDSIEEAALGASGLNAVLRAAADRLVQAGAASIMVVHGDLPLLQGTDLDAVVAAHRGGEVAVVGTDRAGRGTNLLLFNARYKGIFAFGDDSCARHQQLLRDSHRRVEVVRREGIALDVDAPDDLLYLQRACDSTAARGRTRSCAYLAESGLGLRMQKEFAHTAAGQ